MRHMKPIPERTMWVFDLTTDPYTNKQTQADASFNKCRVFQSLRQQKTAAPQTSPNSSGHMYF